MDFNITFKRSNGNILRRLQSTRTRFGSCFVSNPFGFLLFSSKYDNPVMYVISTYFLSKELCSSMGGMVSTIAMK